MTLIFIFVWPSIHSGTEVLKQDISRARQERASKSRAAAMTGKEDVLLPQDAQAVDPSKLSALTPEVVSFARRRRGAAKHASPGRRDAMGYGLSRLEGRMCWNNGAWWSIPANRRPRRGFRVFPWVWFRFIEEFCAIGTSCAGFWTQFLELMCDEKC